MKVLIFGFNYYNYSMSMYEAVQHLGYDVKLIYDPRKYKQNNLALVKQQIFEYAPDIFINYCGNYGHDVIDTEILKKLNTTIKIYICADKLSRFGHINQHIDLYDYVYVFEPSDKIMLENKYENQNINILEVGADEKVYASDLSVIDKEYDVVFAGGFDLKRLKFFEALSKYAFENNIKMALFSSFYKDDKFFTAWYYKKKFKNKYPYIYKYAVNHGLNPEELAATYKKAKICINCHIDIHEGMNFRNFEIMANNNFCLSDYKEISKNYGLVDGVNIAFYNDIFDCISKIKYYLNNEQQREDISFRGGEFVREKYLMKYVMQRIFDKVLHKE